MADTVLTELKIHEFDTVAQFLQHESEVGENDLAFTPFMPANMYLFYHHWADHIVNDPSWLRADTFSWQSGDVYVAAYQHLVNDLETKQTHQVQMYGWGRGVLTTSQSPNVGDSVYAVYSNNTPTKIGVVLSYDSSSNKLTYTDEGVEYTETPRDEYNPILARDEYEERIDGTTVVYYLSQDGHRICLPDQESNIVALYEATGSAWFYVLDTDNKQFKLPRSKHNKYADTVPVFGNGMVLGLDDGTTKMGLINAYYNAIGLIGHSENGYGGTIGTAYSTTNKINYQGLGVTTDPQKSGVIAQLQQDTDQYKYLYFYVGHFEQDELEKNAGISTELFNGKADRNLMNTTDNVDIVIESQLPTADNGYTWYRKYKSGWVEQGGYDSATFNTKTCNFPIEMKDSNYTLALSVGYGDIGSQNGKFGLSERTTTGFTYKVVSLSGSATGKNLSWQVSGYAA